MPHILRSFVCALLSVCVLGSAAAQAPLSPLEQSLMDKRYSEFQKNAAEAAGRSDAEALFLLGKASALGWGVEQDLNLARSYYLKAEALGSVRATHNLGVLALDAGESEVAIGYFLRALEGGIRMPTLWNLGRAYAKKTEQSGLPLAGKVDAATKSAEYYTRAFDATQELEHAENAAAQFLRAYDLARVGKLRGEIKAADLPASRARAVTWLKKAMDKGSARAWSNWGGLLYVEGDLKQARKAFERAAKGDVPQAHQYLGKMAESDHPDAPQAAIAHYERAFELGHPEARAELERLLLASLKYEKDLDVVGRGIKRLQELLGEAEADRDLADLVEDYEWRRFLAQEKAKGRRVPDLPIYLNACKLNEAFAPNGLKKFFPNSYWSLGGVGVDFVEPLPIDGKLDGKGCASIAKPLPENVRKMLNEGGMMFLRFHGTGRFMLEWEVKGQQVHLVPRPTGALRIRL